MKRRVVITGIGAVTPLGNTFSSSWAALLEGRSGIVAPPPGIADIAGIADIFDKIKAVGLLDGFDPLKYLSLKEVRRLDPFARYAVAAAHEAIQDAGIGKGMDAGMDIKKNSGGGAYVIIGSSRGGITTIERAVVDLHFNNKRVSPYLMPATTVVMAASYIAQKFGYSGGALGVSTACASGATAVGEAVRLIRHGYADTALAGGAEAPVCRICIEGYFSAGALSCGAGRGACRPFAIGRDGFVLSEGACVLVLEELESAKSRGARIYAEVAGYADACDAFDQVRPDFMGEARTISAALADAGIKPDEVDFINAHGTSTPLGDIAEGRALREVFAGRIADIPVTACKSMTGHMLAASGAFEAAVSAMTVYEGVLPPSINSDEIDPRCVVRVSGSRLEGDFKVGVSNSFGFGGVNAVLVVRRVGGNFSTGGF
jgi:3-oxoacyl-[acyl-carrier-protein] synthase II